MDKIADYWTFLGLSELAIDVKGSNESWAAPVAAIFAPQGLSEAHWVTETPEVVVGIRLAGAHIRDCQRSIARSTESGGNLTVQPKGTPNKYLANGSVSIAQIVLSEKLLDRASEMSGQGKLSGRLRPDLIFSGDRALNATGTIYVQRALNVREPPTVLEMESRLLQFLDALLKLHGSASPAVAPGGALSGWQLRRVTEFMADHIDDNIILEDMASLVKLSAKHFARAFRQSTGVPPHRWLVERRIERARELLATGNLSLAEIALACGFADQSHFTVAFRRSVGVTPGAFRKQVRL